MAQQTFKPEDLFLPTKKYLSQADGQHYIIDELVPRGRLTMLASPPGSGKTRITLGICRAVTQGEDFLGFWSEEGKVLYLNLDLMHQGDIEDRLAELAGTKDLPAWVDDIVWMEHDFNLLGAVTDPETGNIVPNPQTGMGETWEGFLTRYIKQNAFVLVVVDTFHKLMVNSSLDHMDNDDADRILLPLKRIARDTSAAVWLLHHTPLDDENRPRGASAITATVDHLLYANGKINNKLELGITKTRLTESGRFPITIKEDFAHRHIDVNLDGAPMGAWAGIISQEQHEVTASEQKTLDAAKTFETYMRALGQDLGDGLRFARYETLMALYGGNVSILAKVRQYFKREKRLRCERKTQKNPNPIYTFNTTGRF